MKRKIPVFLEYLWLLVAIVSLIMGFFQWYKVGLNEGISFFIITLVSIFMYAYRRRFRIQQNRKNQ